jgi:hypothetical protein
MSLRWIAGCSVVFALVLAAPTSGASSPAERPIYFIHGVNLNASVKCSMWDPMMKSFKAWGIKGSADFSTIKADEVRFHTVGYYHGDTGCNTSIDASGDHSKVLGPPEPVSGPQPHREGSHTINTPIEHIAHHLAWSIYDSYTVAGQPVDVVAHSMGGLIIRYALAATARGVAGFPPRLLVEDVVTLGTPHGGWRVRAALGRQVAQMISGSSLLKSLWKYGFNPQGAGGTDWTTVGSDDDTAVAADRAVGTDRDRDPRNKYIGSRHKIWYTAVNHIEHSDYYKNPTTNSTAIAWVALAGKPFRSKTLAIVHPMRLTFFALRSPNS